jgi:hypothetical protein
MHYNRKERKNLAKQLGLKTANETREQRSERTSRAREAGNQIHQQFLMQNENTLRNQQVEKDAEVLRSLTEKHGAEEAARILANNKKIEEKRREKLLKKKNQQ